MGMCQNYFDPKILTRYLLRDDKREKKIQQSPAATDSRERWG